jgi:hypothetical protein
MQLVRSFVKFLLLTFIIFCFSCKNKIHISGIVVDGTSKMPLDNVLIRTIKDGNTSGIDFAETKSKLGRFDLKFFSRSINSNEITVELSKEGYLTNIYSCFQDRLNDTLFLVRNY